MPQPLQVQPQNGPTAGTTVASVDPAGNVTTAGKLTVGGPLALTQQASAPGAVPGQLQLYTTDGLTMNMAAPGGQMASLTVPGNLTVNGTTFVAGEQVFASLAAAQNVTVGSTTALGDNGVGELQLANATTVPTTNPTGGSVIYAVNGGVFLRDPAGSTWAMISAPGEQSYPTPGAMTETCHRYTVTSSAAPPSGTLVIMSCFLMAGQKIGHIGFGTGTTPTTSASHWWGVLLDNTFKQQAHTADQGAVNLTASTWYNLATTATFTATYTGQYYLGIMIAVSAGGVATLLTTAAAPAAQMVTGTNVPTPVIGGLSSTAQTTPGTDGVTVYAAPTAASSNFYMYGSA